MERSFEVRTQPKVAITIPTFNSSPTLGLCLEAVQNQTYSNYVVVIIDGGSSDSTEEIARKLRVDRFLVRGGGLLKARYAGVMEASGKYVLLLDSDQILAPDALERAVAMMEGQSHDMLVLGERSYRTETLTEKLFDLDRKLLHASQNLDPATGAVLPRFYRTKLLRKAVGQIPPEVMETVGGEDHAIIYWEAWKLSQKVGFLPKAVMHIEPRSMSRVWQKAYRWGATSHPAYSRKYGKLLAQRPWARFKLSLVTMVTQRMLRAGLGSLALMFWRGLAYNLGRLASCRFSVRGRERKI